MIKAILFDMDGTLFDTERLYYRCWKKVAKENGYDIPDELLNKMRGASLKEGSRHFNEYFNYEKDYFEERAKRQLYVKEEINKNGVPFKKGLVELFKFLKENGIKIALATSTIKEMAERYIEISGLSEYFDAIVTGDMIEHGKPDPDIFLLAAKNVGENIENCAVAEDSLNGIIAGRRSGAKVFFIPDLSPVSLEEKTKYVDKEFESLDDIIGYLA
ncbi:MAG: HAD family phosphatase [Eubacteriales bacterium]|nr:HAD family phosphatase [Eubacteriales bacterium]